MTLAKLEKVKYLGVWIDRLLQWDAHFEEVRKRVCCGVAVINRVKEGLPPEERKTLYHAFIEPHRSELLLLGMVR